MKLYTLDHHYFSIPSIENCYFAGFIAADGCINGVKKNQLGIEIKSTDIELLERFKSDLLFTGKIHIRIQKIKTGPNNKYIYDYTGCRIGLTSQSICNDLRTNFNITPRKSLTLQPPNLENDELIKSFITGYIDGDGSISIQKQDKLSGDGSKYYKYEKLYFEIAGQPAVLNWIKFYFDKWIPKETNAIDIRQSGKNIMKYSIFNSRAYKIGILLDSIDRPYRMSRKWDNLQEYYSRHSENINNLSHNPRSVKW